MTNVQDHVFHHVTDGLIDLALIGRNCECIGHDVLIKLYTVTLTAR